MKTSVDLLFDEFAVRHARGEAPDVRDYLSRAGDERDDLGRMIDRYLAGAPPRQPSEEEVVLLQSRIAQEPPLLVLRQRRKLGRQAVVDGLVKMLSLDVKQRDKVARYYHELEVGLLDPVGVSARVWDTLRRLLGGDAERLAVAPRPTGASAGVAAAYLRTSDARSLSELEAAPPAAAREEPDEIDRLFTGGR